MNFFSPLVHQYPLLTRRCPSISSLGRRFSYRIGFGKCFSAISAEQELTEFLQYLDSLKNYEKVGVPKDAGTDSEGGFDLGRMSRLMQRLGNPQSNFKAIHIAGTKGKGSTAAFLSNILRAEGYSVGSYTSPHIQTIRERISLGRTGELVSAKVLNCIFHKNKRILDESVELENGCLSHFEVLTAMAFSLFAQEKVDFAVVEAGLGGARDATNIISSSGLTLSVITTIGEEHLAALGGSLESIAMAKSGIIKHGCPLVLGGPFLPHIESILRDKASSMSSPVVLASDSGNRSFVKSISIINGRLCQSCDIVIHTEKDIQLFIELLDLKLVMIGTHQLQNAATATCAALCLRNLGWRISNRSIRAGLEQSFLLGRSQLLTSKDVEALGVPEAMILLDGAHTKESAKALANTIKMAFPSARLALVVAMASDKDHVGFAREFLSGGGKIEAVILTEIDIGGGKSRTTPASLLRDSWLQACEDLGYFGYHENDPSVGSAIRLKNPTVLISETSLAKSIKIASKNLGDQKTDDRPRLVVVTGSLHIVSSVLASLSQ